MLIGNTCRGVAQFLLALCVCLMPSPTAGNGRLGVQLLEYRSVHSGGGGGGGGIRFEVSVARFDSSKRKQQLFRYRQATDNYTDSGVITFGKHVGTLENPFFVDFNFTDNQGHGSIEVSVESANSTSGGAHSIQLAQFTGELITSSLAVTTGNASAGSGKVVQVTTTNLTSADQHRSLQVSHWFVCLPGSYSQLCNRQCLEQDSDTGGHYTCDPASGDKVCRQGWSSPQSDCKQRLHQYKQQQSAPQKPQQSAPQQSAPQKPQQSAPQQPQQSAPQKPQQSAPQQPQQSAPQKPQQSAPQQPHATPSPPPPPQQQQQPPETASAEDDQKASSRKTLLIVLVSLSLCILLIAAVASLSVVMSPDSSEAARKEDHRDSGSRVRKR